MRDFNDYRGPRRKKPEDIFVPRYNLREILGFAIDVLKKGKLNPASLYRAVNKKYPSYSEPTAREHLNRLIAETDFIKKILVKHHYEYILNPDLMSNKN